MIVGFLLANSHDQPKVWREARVLHYARPPPAGDISCIEISNWAPSVPQMRSRYPDDR